jgi:hypothetical protein
MKPALAAFTIASALALGACADELEQPTTQEVSERLGRGIRGQGTIGPRDRSDDPYVRGDSPGAFEPRPEPQTPPTP